MPNIRPLQNTPVLPNIRRIVRRPNGASCSRRNSAKPSRATMRFPPLHWVVRHSASDQQAGAAARISLPLFDLLPCITHQRSHAMPVVETERHGQILVVRMNRPERLNALSHQLRSSLAETWTAFRHDNDLEVAIF